MADVAVRTASPADAGSVADIHLRTWQTAYAALLPEQVLAELDIEQTRSAWLDAIEHPASTVFLATEGGTAVGFCVAGPSPEADAANADGSLPEDSAHTGLISSLLVEPRWGRRGHGGRLLAAAAEALRERGARRGITWIPEADEASLGLYRDRAGWQPDGTVRTLDAAGQPLREIRVAGPLELTLVEPAS
ncbi:L-amino acid N-acyltransferase YncA [Tamaricihabitans halophyticus]|uniref:L-amino acid N-acyltransferase YncA n=1 Tax=Tamaricihabitans halophyticus TaxID=1262583 RepID=A0A4R2QT12_9PSEU|nr:GNAT family N-acetyltransferase [Tamaricihabitans halophyticus]TCP50155.1 L-amino acid N-acyltransferase YncA [Tamaricihabitans halophyticus]